MSKGVYYTMGLNSAGFMSGAQSVQSILARLESSVSKLAVTAQKMQMNVQVNGTEKATQALGRTAAAVARLKATFNTLSNVGSGISNIVNGAQSAKQGITMLQSLANSGGRAGQMLKGAAGAAQRFASMLRGVSWQKLIAGAAAATAAVTGVVIAYRAASLAARGGAAALSMPFKLMAASAKTAAGAVRTVGGAVSGALTTGLTAMLSPLGLVIGAVGTLTAGFKALSLGMDFEQMSVGMNTIIKDARVTAGLLGQIQRFSSTNGQSMFDSSKGARALLGGGWGVDEVMPMMQTLGDVAAGAQTDLGGLIMVLNQVKGKGKLYAEELQQFSERGIAGLREALAQVRGTSIEQLFEDMQNGLVNVTHLTAAFELMTSESGLFFNAMANQSKTSIGLLGTLKSKAQELVLVFASPSNDGLKPMLEGAIATLDNLIEKAKLFMGQFSVAVDFGFLGEFLFDQLRVGLAKAGNYAVSIFSGVVAAFGSLFGDVIDFPTIGSLLANAFKMAVAGFKGAMLDALQELNQRLPKFMQMDKYDLKLASENAGIEQEMYGQLAKIDASSFLKKLFSSDAPRKMWEAFASGKQNASKPFDERIGEPSMMAWNIHDTQSALAAKEQKDALLDRAQADKEARETAQKAREEQEKANEAKKQEEEQNKKTTTSTQNLSNATNRAGNAFSNLLSKMNGSDDEPGRKKIVTMNRAQSLARRILRTSPRAQHRIDPKMMPHLKNFIKEQPPEFFRGLPGAGARKDGTSVLEKLLEDVVSELKNVKSSIDEIQTA